MNVSYQPSPEFEELLGAMCDGRLSAQQSQRLEEIVAGGSDDDCWYYLRHIHLHGTLYWNIAHPMLQPSFAPEAEGLGVRGQVESRSHLPDGTENKAEGERRKAEEKAGRLVDFGSSVSPSPTLPFSSSSFPPSPSLLPASYPSHSFLPSFLPSTPLGNVAFSYAMSAVLVGIGLFIFSLMSASSPSDTVVINNPTDSRNHTPSNVPSPTPEPKIVSIARITGMVDCRWVNTNDAPFHDRVVQGDKFMLKSGLMEITYHTGAKVILQGPCTYEVESAVGGYLSLGKLTARVESRSRLPSGRSRFRLPDWTSPTDRNTTKSRPAGGTYFSVRTPTATVTDLGTEFGVEVDGRSGNTISHVFQGKVKVVTTAAGSQPSSEVVLGENQSARVEKSNVGAPSIITQNIAVKPGQFARADVLRELSLKQFRRWQRFSEELRRRDDLLAYYDFQRDADNPRDKNDAELLRNRAKTGPRFDGHVWGTLRMGMAQGRFPGKEALKFANPGDGVRVNIPVECKQMTVAAWVNITQLISDLSLLSSDGWNPGAVHWNIEWGIGGRMVFASDFGPDVRANSPPVFNDGVCRRWIHLAATHDSVARKTTYYLDGQSIGETTAGTSVAFRYGAATIGAWLDSVSQRTFQGRIDELTIFSRVLSLSEIARLHEEGNSEVLEGKSGAIQ